MDTDVYDTSSDDDYAGYDMDTYEYTTDAPDNPYGSTDYFDLAADSPLADEIRDYEDEFYEYENYSTGQADGAYEDVVEDSTYETYDDSLCENPTYEVPDSQTGDNDSAVGDTPTTGDDPDTENTVAPFATAKLLNLDTSALPLHALRDSLFEVEPDGTASFNNANTTNSSVDASAADVESASSTEGATADETQDDQSPELIDVAHTVVIDQTYNGPHDWVVSQSISNAWGTPAPTVADDTSDGSAAVGGSNESDAASPAEPMRGQGTETYSITVINGTTTITSYSISESFSFGAGDAIPAEWIGAATASVNDQPDELQVQPADGGPVVYGAPQADSATEAESSATDSGATSTIVAPTAEPAAEKPKRGFTTSSTMDTVVIETKVTLDDGQPGIQRVMTISFSASFSWHDGDTIDLTAPPKTTKTETRSESSGANGSDPVTFSGDSAADPVISSSAPTTTTPASTPDIEHTYTYNAFASGSIAGSFSVTTVYPEASGLLGMLTGQSSTTFGFGMSAMAGGSSTRKFTMKESSASGDAASETDEHLEVDILDETSSSNFTGFSFSIGNASSSAATTADSGSMTTTGGTTDSSSTATASDSAANSAITASNLQPQDGDVIVTPTSKPKAGQQSAADSVANGVSGFQIGFDTNSSSSSTKDFQYSELTRQLNSDYWGEGHSKVTFNDFQHSESDSNISIGFGGDSTHFEISRSHSSETNLLLQSDDYSLGRYMTEDDYMVMRDQVFYKEVGDSSSEFRIAFGDVQDAGLVNESDSSLSIKGEVVERIDYAGWFNTVTRTYIFRDGLEGKPPAVPSGATNDIAQVTMTDPPADDTSSIIRDTTTYTDNSGTTVVVHMEGVPGDDGATEPDSSETSNPENGGTGYQLYDGTTAPSTTPDVPVEGSDAAADDEEFSPIVKPPIVNPCAVPEDGTVGQSSNEFEASPHDGAWKHWDGGHMTFNFQLRITPESSLSNVLSGGGFSLITNGPSRPGIPPSDYVITTDYWGPGIIWAQNQTQILTGVPALVGITIRPSGDVTPPRSGISHHPSGANAVLRELQAITDRDVAQMLIESHVNGGAEQRSGIAAGANPAWQDFDIRTQCIRFAMHLSGVHSPSPPLNPNLPLNSWP